jgi:membrane-associated phospholipid phosphatase
VSNEASAVEARLGWRDIVRSFQRPYPVSIPMVLLVSLVPFYIFIAGYVRGRPLHAPELPLDRALPLLPTWSLVYGALYLFLIVLPVFIVREHEHLRRTVYAFLTIWVTAYAFFLAYPTIAPRPAEVAASGFGAWGLRGLYGMDPPRNCFPSLHVAHSFVSALTCFRVHREVGIVAIASAALVAVSTLFTKQHYVADVVAGTLLALVAYAIFLRSYARDRVRALDRRLAPLFAAFTLGLSGLCVVGAFIGYLILERM